MSKKRMFAASVQAKKGRLYAVISAPEDGKNKNVWRKLGLPQDAPKTQVNKRFREVVNLFEENWADYCNRRENPIGNMTVYEYLEKYLKRASKSLQKNTISGYESMLYGKIKRYFGNKDITVLDLKPHDILDFYDTITADGCSPNTIIHYHAFMRKAFASAFKEDAIPTNPFDKVDRPKRNKFQGTFFSEEELRTLLEGTKDDVIYPAIVLAGGLGVRRSEALGIRWSRINWEERTVLLDTKIIEYIENGKKVVEPEEEMKNKSSKRTLPLPVQVYEMLLEQKERCENFKKLFRNSYNKKYDDYVCVNQLGELIAPDYLTARFPQLLKKLGMRHIRFHDLRHTFASILINNDVPLINVSGFLGHSDISTTANIYAHLDKTNKQGSADMISEILSK